MSFKKVLIAIDASPVAAHAAEVGADLARALNAEIALIHVFSVDVPYGSDIGIPPKELEARADAEGQSVIEGFRERMRLTSALTFAVAGVPAVEVAKAAKEWSADLIVVGSHGREGMQRALLGSVAEGVMRRAPCPVLVVRAKN